ncbi:MAG: ABC transporter permease [Bacteroidota bacterium]
MLRNYLKTSYRTLIKNWSFSVINILGLTLGVTSCLLILFFVQDELSYDKFHEKGDRIYRVAGSFLQGGDKRNQSAQTTYQLGPALQTALPIIENKVRIQRFSNLVEYGEKRFIEERILHADSSFFDVFTFPLIQGNPKKVLEGTNTVVISEAMAQKYFGEKDPVGEFIKLEGRDMEVSGVMQDMPSNSHIQADMVISTRGAESFYPKWVLDNWTGTSHHLYIQLPEQTDHTQVEQQIAEFISQFYNDGQGPIYTLQPLQDIHLHSELTGEIEPAGDIAYIYVFSCVALIIIVIACINYMNLSTARSIDRAKEVGLRKSIGAHKGQLIFQFLSESIVISLVAFTLAGVSAELLLPYFNHLTGKEIAGARLIRLDYIAALFGCSLFVGVLSGSYPAFFLSSFKASGVLKGSQVQMGKGYLNLRKLLVIIQFCISITLIIGTLVIQNQISFMRNTKLGMNPDLLVKIPLQTREMAEQYESFRNVLVANQSITQVTASSNDITSRIGGWRPYYLDGQEEEILIPTIIVEHDFLKTLEADLVQGRDFSRDRSTDEMGAYILNESAVDFLGLEEPIGTPIVGSAFTGSQWSRKNAQIIGVVKDFHFASLHSEIQPIAFSLHSENTMGLGFIVARINGDDLSQTIKYIENKWKEFSPSRPFNYSFVDEDIHDLYIAEDKFHKVFSIFSMLAVLIACLGILGLAAFTIRKRVKEIGIRKVLGASIPGITVLLSKDFTKLVLIANVVAWPLAWYMMDNWLEDFAYKIELNVWTFLLGMVITLAIAFVTVSVQSIRAAVANPVDALKET